MYPNLWKFCTALLYHKVFCSTCQAVSSCAKLLLARQLDVQLEQRLVEGVHDGVDVGRAAGEVPAAAQGDLLCALASQIST